MPKKLLRFGHGFSVVMGNVRGQAATMVLGPGESEGGPDNRHRGSDQWLYVASGNGRAVVGGKPQKLTPGSLVLIERGTAHEIRNSGRSPLRTLNFYIPPAYTRAGDESPKGRK